MYLQLLFSRTVELFLVAEIEYMYLEEVCAQHPECIYIIHIHNTCTIHGRVKSVKTVTVRGESLDDHQKAIAPSSAATAWAYER